MKPDGGWKRPFDDPVPGEVFFDRASESFSADLIATEWVKMSQLAPNNLEVHKM